MLKKEAIELSRQLKNEHPEWYGKPCRIVTAPTSGYDSYTVWYLAEPGPRGGYGKSRRIGAETPGCEVVFNLSVGDVLVRCDWRNRWPYWSSEVIMPHMEELRYAHPECKALFGIEEKIAALKWYITNASLDDSSDPFELSYQLDQLEEIQKQQLRWSDLDEAAEQMYSQMQR